jgi:hypothetical protein
MRPKAYKAPFIDLWLPDEQGVAVYNSGVIDHSVLDV